MLTRRLYKRPPPRLPPVFLGPQVELHQENNAYLSYWLSNTVTLLYLMQKNVKPASGGGYAARIKAQGQQVGVHCCCSLHLLPAPVHSAVFPSAAWCHQLRRPLSGAKWQQR